MRGSTRTFTILAAAATAVALAAPAHAGSAPVLQFAGSPSPAYGNVAVGQPSDKTFTVTNMGGTATAALKVTLAPSAAFTIPAGGDKCTAVSLGPKKSCTVTVSYTPAAAGANDSATVTASAKKPALPAIMTLTGTSPTGLSLGCAAIHDNGYANAQAASGIFKSGEVVTLKLSTPQDLSLIAANMDTWTYYFPGLTFTIPEDGAYGWGLTSAPADAWVWDCSLPAL
jgi:hypothetical protein